VGQDEVPRIFTADRTMARVLVSFSPGFSSLSGNWQPRPV